MYGLFKGLSPTSMPNGKLRVLYNTSLIWLQCLPEASLPWGKFAWYNYFPIMPNKVVLKGLSEAKNGFFCQSGFQLLKGLPETKMASYVKVAFSS